MSRTLSVHRVSRDQPAIPSCKISWKKSWWRVDLATMMFAMAGSPTALALPATRMCSEDSGAAVLEQLATRMRDGDPEAFTAWVRALHPLVYRLCRRFVFNPIDAEDAVQDTFIRAWRSASTLRNPAAHRSWLCQLARRACADRARRASTRERPALDLSAASTGSHAVISDECPADEALHAVEVRAGVAIALARIKEQHRVILLLREVDELSYDEIADALGVPIGTVESRLHRARAALGRALDRHRLISERTAP